MRWSVRILAAYSLGQLIGLGLSVVNNLLNDGSFGVRIRF
jgi:hypothetical protein